MSKHTEGPWEAIARGTNSETWEAHKPTFQQYEIRAEDGHTIADLRWNGRNQGPVGQANAHLIAAAPDLLEACKTLDEILCAGPMNQSERMIARQKLIAARAAIAKATQP